MRAILGLALVAAAASCALLPAWLAPQDPNEQDLRMARKPPIWLREPPRANLFGTDHLGRDVLSRVIYGSRVSLAVAFGSVVLGGLMGVALGLVAGSTVSRVGDILMRLVDVQMAIPIMVMAIVLVGVLGQSARNVVTVFALAVYPSFARVTRGEVLQLREREFITAAVAVGAGRPRLIVRHLVPNLLGPVLVIAMLEMAAVILYESGLGFLGLSVPPHIPSWGGMLADGRQYMTTAWWIAMFPGLAIVLTVLGLNLFSEWAHKRLAPEMRE